MTAMSVNLDLCRRVIEAHEHTVLFATISGAHLYGFPSADSDYDLRGVHLAPLRQVLSLDPPRETCESMGVVEGVEIDLVTHDLAKFIRLLLKKNGYVLEQLLSPIVVRTSPVHDELKRLAQGCVTRHHADHYLGFAETQWKLVAKHHPPTAKSLLYLYRVLLTGLHLIRTGELEANLRRLNQIYALSFIDGLIEAKTKGGETSSVLADLAFHEKEYAKLRERLEAARAGSPLPEAASSKAELSELLVRTRLRSDS